MQFALSCRFLSKYANRPACHALPTLLIDDHISSSFVRIQSQMFGEKHILFFHYLVHFPRLQRQRRCQECRRLRKTKRTWDQNWIKIMKTLENTLVPQEEWTDNRAEVVWLSKRLRPENHQMQANLNDYYARPWISRCVWTDHFQQTRLRQP